MTNFELSMMYFCQNFVPHSKSSICLKTIRIGTTIAEITAYAFSRPNCLHIFDRIHVSCGTRTRVTCQKTFCSEFVSHSENPRLELNKEMHNQVLIEDLFYLICNRLGMNQQDYGDEDN